MRLYFSPAIPVDILLVGWLLYLTEVFYIFSVSVSTILLFVTDSWRSHDMKTLSELLAFSMGKPPAHQWIPVAKVQ